MSGILLVLTDPVAGCEQEFNAWYESVHLPEILALPSFVSATRYRRNERPVVTLSQSYLTIYRVTDTLRAARELAKAVGRAEITMSPALDDLTVLQGYFDELPATG